MAYSYYGGTQLDNRQPSSAVGASSYQGSQLTKGLASGGRPRPTTSKPANLVDLHNRQPGVNLYGGGQPAGGQAGGALPGANMGGPTAGGPQLPYQPGAPQANQMIDALSGAGQGLLDPNSDYFKQLSGRMSEQMGAQTEAQQRAAALRATRSGLGMGASPELLSAQSEIGTAGMGQMGQAQADLALRAPQVGGQLVSPALSGSIGLQGQALSGYMGQQQLAAQQQAQQLNANLQAQQQAAQQQALQAQMQMQAQQMQQQMALRELSALYGGMF